MNVAYHAPPQGALAITSCILARVKEMFEPVTPGGFQVPNNFYRAAEQRPGLRISRPGLWAANRIEEMILFEAPRRWLIAFLLETGANLGMFFPRPGYPLAVCRFKTSTTCCS
jgi:hypothetical protein